MPGAPGLYYSYNKEPVRLEKQEFDFGYRELEVSMKHLTFSMFTRPSAGKMERSDTITLIKPEGWKPDQNGARALYDSTSATPNPEVNRLLFNTNVIFLLSQMVPGLLESNQEIVAACYGPQTDLFAYAYSPSANHMRPRDSWLYQATLLAFLNSTYQPPTTPTPESAVIQYTLNYLLNSYMNVNKLGNLPPGCQ